MIGSPKRRWLFRSLLGAILALLAWVSFPWFHDSRLIWSIHQPLVTLAQNAPPAVICSDPYGRWVFLKHRPKDKASIVCTVLRQENGQIEYENVGDDQKGKYLSLAHNDITQFGELIYSVLMSNDYSVTETRTRNRFDKELRWCIVKAWNLNDGSHSEKMRVPISPFGWVKLSSNGKTLISYALKSIVNDKGIVNDLEVEVWNTSDARCLNRFTITNATPDAPPMVISSDCRWLILGRGTAHEWPDYPRFSFDIADEEKHQRLGPKGVLWTERSLRVIDLERGVETEEIKGFLSRALDITVQGDLVVLSLFGPLQQMAGNYFYVDLSSSDRTLKPYQWTPNQDKANYGLVTPISFNHWIEVDSDSKRSYYRDPSIKLSRVDMSDGQRREHPYFPFPNTQQASPLGASLMIVNHKQPINAPDWLEPWMTKYDLTNYWPWKECQRMVICDADTEKTVWQKRFPADGHLQADISRDQSKLFVLYWKNDQLEFYAYSLDFSWRSYWQQSCAVMAVFAFVLFFRWPRRNKANPAPVQLSA